jgi:hypothetical protein
MISLAARVLIRFLFKLSAEQLAVPFGKIPVSTKLRDTNREWQVVPKTVNLSDLTPTQMYVSRARLENMLKAPPEDLALVVRSGNENLVLDGHHRLALKALAGEKNVLVNFALNTEEDVV